MTATNETLDSLLPLLQPDGSELHLNAAIVEVVPQTGIPRPGQRVSFESAPPDGWV